MSEEEDSVSDLNPDAACYYDRVGIDPRADDIERAVEKAYHDANDRRRDDEMSPKEFNRIKEARNLLRDETDREQYDTFLEQYGRDAGTEAYHTWDDQGRPASPETWTPPSQSPDVGPEHGRTPESDEEDDEDDSETSGERRDRTDREGDQRTPDPDRRQRRQRSEDRDRNRPETNRDSGARTRERTRQRDERQPRDSEQPATESIEVATATEYRLGYLLCTIGIVGMGGLFAAILLQVVQLGFGPVAMVYLLSLLGALGLTRRWTDAVDATPDPETVYDNVTVRPGKIKYIVIAGLLLTVVQTIVAASIPQILANVLGLLGSIGLFFVPVGYILTQTYDVTLGNLATRAGSG